MSNIYCIRTGRALTASDLVPTELVGYSDQLIIDRLEARFGDSQLKGGMINLNSVKVTKSKVYIDSYGRGNTHNSIWQYKAKTNWNRPMPFPSMTYTIRKAFETYKNKEFVLGYKSDPFMWADMKYGTTKEVLRLAQLNNIKLTIETMSDLVAHDNYLELLQGCIIVMNMGSGDENTEREDSPGAPSIARREKAVEKLKEYGIKVQYKVKNTLFDIFNPIRKVKEA
jgi:hypothetical protein